MLASELIKQLTELKDRYGDLPVLGFADGYDFEVNVEFFECVKRSTDTECSFCVRTREELTPWNIDPKDTVSVFVIS